MFTRVQVVQVFSQQLKGGQAFFRVIISFGLGPPEVAPYIAGIFFGEVFRTSEPYRLGATPRP